MVDVEYNNSNVGFGLKHLREYVDFENIKEFSIFLKENSIEPFCSYKSIDSIYEVIRQIERCEPFYRIKKECKIQEKINPILDIIENLLEQKEFGIEKIEDKNPEQYKKEIKEFQKYKTKFEKVKDCLEELFSKNKTPHKKENNEISYMNI